jgi:hypothetical protein
VPEIAFVRSSRGQAAETKVFCLKGATVTVAAFVFVIGVFPIGQRFVERQLTKRTDQLAVEKTELRELLKSGSGFRMAAEKKLYARRDQEDLSSIKKAEIIAAIKKVSVRYRPFLEAAETPSRE